MDSVNKAHAIASAVNSLGNCRVAIHKIGVHGHGGDETMMAYAVGEGWALATDAVKQDIRRILRADLTVQVQQAEASLKELVP